MTDNFITLKQLQAAFEKVKNAKPEVCGYTKPHLVHPNGGHCHGCGIYISKEQIYGKKNKSL